MKIVQSQIDGVLILEPNVFSDGRGYFFESFREDIFFEKVCKTQFVQDNEAKSNYGVLRGLHYQIGEHAQAKLVRVVQGSVLDVAVDLRKGSPTFGKYVAIELNENNKFQMFIPRGFAHGYVVLQDNTIFNYKCDNYYAPGNEGGVNWADKELNIDWNITAKDLIISKKDSALPYLNIFSDFL